MNSYIKLSILFPLLLLAISTCGQTAGEYYASAKTAYEEKKFDDYYENLVKANELHPYHQVILYHLGIASALTGHKEQAFECLRQALYIDSSFDLERSDFEVIKSDSRYAALEQMQKEISTPITTSTSAFGLADKSAHVEAIGFDERTKNFYFGAIHKRKIVRRDKNGKITDFVKAGAYSMTSVFAVKVDSKKDILWACSSPMQEMENYDSTLNSAVFKFDLKTGELKQKFETNDNTTSNVFGDLYLSKSGEIFVSDSKNNIIYKVNEQTGQLDSFYSSDEFWNIQGISFSDDGQSLYISDYIKGPYRLSLSNRKLVKLSSDFEESLKGIDGLIYYNGSLITIQNGITPARVSRYSLSKSLNTLTSIEILDRAHPDFNEPTNGILIGNSLYYVANSPWAFYDENFLLKDDEINDLVILKNTLK